MIDDQEEYEVEQIISHRYYGHKKAMQYLICWKGYSATDDTWELANQVFVDTLMKAYHRKHPLNGGKTSTFATHLQAALAKSHWHPHSPLMNFGVTGLVTKQDYTGAQKISAPMVPIASGTAKNMSTPTHCTVTQPTKPTAKANALERSALKKSIHRALVKFFSCLLPHTPLHSPTAPTAGWIIVVQCSMPLNASRLLATMTATLTHGQSASMAGNASLSWKAFPTSTPANAALSKPFTALEMKIGCSPWPWRALNIIPNRWSKPSPSLSVTVQLPAKWESDVMAWLAHMPENCGGMCGDPMMGSGRLPEGRSESIGPRMEAGEPLEGRLTGNNEVSMSHGRSGQDLDYLACQPILAQSTQCKDESLAQEAAQWSLDASVSLMIVHD